VAASSVNENEISWQRGSGEEKKKISGGDISEK